MSAKQKMAIAITALCLVAVVAIVTVIAVFAASTQTFTSSVTVSYTVEDVQCTVSAKYYTGKGLTGEGVSMKDTDKVRTELVFGTGDTQGTTLQPESEIKLTSSDKVVIFEYIFKNDSSEHAFTAELKYTGTAKNVTVRTNEDGTQLTPSSDFDSDEETHFPTEKTVTSDPNFTTTQAINVAESATVYVYVRVAIADVAKDASFAGGFAWTLKQA